MKKILIFLFTVCFTAQFSLAQEQARLSVAPLDSNVNCDKATVIPHTFNNNEFLVDSFANKNGNAYYTFTATSKSGKIRILTDDAVSVIISNDCQYSNYIINNKGYKYFTGYFDNLTVGKKYIIWLRNYYGKKFKLTVIADKKADNVPSTPTTISGTPYNFYLGDYSKGREGDYSNASYCSTTKADTNVVTVFVKFKATSTSATLDLNLNNASLESRLGLTSAPKTCQAIQKNKNLRTDTFTGLTIGNEYTVRIEIGGDAALGYARTATANNASITLVGGATTGIETVSQPTFGIAPNPSNGNFSFISDENADLEISDLLGAKVAILQKVSHNQNIDLQLAKGIYLLKVTNTKGSKIEKLVIE